MNDKILNQKIDLDAFLDTFCILPLGDNQYLHEDGDILMEVNGDKIKISRYSGEENEIEEKIETSLPLTLNEGFELAKKAYGWDDFTEEELEEYTNDYLIELSRRKYNKELEIQAIKLRSKYLK
jgi:hypothetical protein